MFERNVGETDRTVRAVVGGLLAVATLGAFLLGRRRLGGVTLIASAGLLFNAVSGFCGLNAALGIDTAEE